MASNLKTKILGGIFLTAVSFVTAHAAGVSIAAVVGDDIITTSDIAERRALIMATAGIPATAENQQRILPRVMQSLIDETLQMQEAKRNSITISDEEVAKAIADTATRSENGETVLDFIKKQGLSERSFEAQARAQLAWTKVVQRKLRRNVSIAQDEIARASAAEAATPGEIELRLTAFEIRPTKGKEDAANKLAEEITLQLRAGADSAGIASRYIRQSEVQYNPPIWIAEKDMPPQVQQALRTLKPGEASPPLRSSAGIQIIQLLERKTAPKLSDATEYAIKQIAVTVPKKRDKASLNQLHEAVNTLRTNPGDCISETVPMVSLPVDVKFVRTRVGAMTPQQRQIISRLEVGEVSEPLMGPDAVRLVVMCEKIEPAGGDTPDVERIRQQLFAEKLELEAQKHMRNLRRDAFIDIKGAR